uniref:START domain-containing protein n=1 Tax=Eutreptiella gymnastica TaxID=73025 RepID=A0A7S4G648_9EUGL|mmetsp:Transcript_33654/g.55321  ORF Transcript_33654/g.55321 Transcript_33654/m.55321 type:complete len:194 (-) Transcript_33654:681-1262(-)
MSGWAEPVIGPTANGVRIWRRSLAGSDWDEVRGSGVIHCRPETVVALFETSDVPLIRSFNPCYDTGHDVECYSPAAKVAYARLKSAFPGFRPRDTVTAVEQHNVLPALGGGTVFLLKAFDHPDVPPAPGYVRAKLSGLNLVQPIPGKPEQCEFTFTQLVDPGGAIPAWIMNMLVSREAVDFFARIRRAAQGSH